MPQDLEIAKLTALSIALREKLFSLCEHFGGMVHIGGDLSMCEILTVLFHHVLRHDPAHIDDPQRDRFVLSKGHGAVCMYVAMALRGFFDYDEVVRTYNQLDSAFGMHPCKVHLPGVETSTGSLGQGLAIANGMALMARSKGEGYRTFCLLGDGETCEGEVWEAAMLSASYKLGNVVAVVDRNRQFMTAYSDDKYIKLEPYADKWRSFGWNVLETDGHDIAALTAAFAKLPDGGGDTPTVVICDTVKGKGVSFMERNIGWHAGVLTKELAAQCRAELRQAAAGRTD